jgi:hypothetical protein
MDDNLSKKDRAHIEADAIITDMENRAFEAVATLPEFIMLPYEKQIGAVQDMAKAYIVEDRVPTHAEIRNNFRDAVREMSKGRFERFRDKKQRANQAKREEQANERQRAEAEKRRVEAKKQRIREKAEAEVQAWRDNPPEPSMSNDENKRCYRAALVFIAAIIAMVIIAVSIR